MFDQLLITRHQYEEPDHSVTFLLTKRLLESGDSATVKQVGDGKDIISLLSTSIEPYFTTAGLTYTEVQANAVASEEGQLSEEELLAQMT